MVHMDALSGHTLCTTCDVINLNVTRYSCYKYVFSRARINLSSQQSVLKNNVVSFGAKGGCKMADGRLIFGFCKYLTSNF